MSIGLVALLRCVLLVLRLRDWRIAILGALVLLLLAHTLSEAPSWWSLPVSVLVLASVLVV
ncbi:MAG: hypothetical protein Q7J79_07705, partial [Gemmatimonadales bacterium]|nr:hypothetical protein [Gemmatimonadales bacterium]